MKKRSGRGSTFQPAFFEVLAVVFMLAAPMRGQEASWSFSGYAGYAFLPMKEVNRDNRHDVRGWQDLGIPIPDFPVFNGSTFLTGKIIYRPSPYLGLSLSFLTTSIGGETSYSDSGATLYLKRSVGSSDKVVGLIGYLPSRWYPFEFYLEIGIWYTAAWAKARAYGETTISVQDTSYRVIIADADGRYQKTKTTVGIGLGASVPVATPLVLKAEVRYRNALLGPMEGDITRFGETSTESSTIDFNVSGLFVSIGLAIEF